MIELTPALVAHASRAEVVLDRVLPKAGSPPEQLHRAMRYGVLGGGKRLRPMLVYSAAEAVGGRLETADASAAAVELIHAYSLIHDDLPAMDNDELRRGKPTCHRAFGEATAILAGDALQALAFEVLSSDTSFRAQPALQVAMLRVLAAACGSHGMAGGQAFDLAAVGARLSAEQLERMHVHKTGALIRASVALGLLSAGCVDATVLGALDRYAHHVGLAFQIRDDILDVQGETDVIGKQRGADRALDKPTYPSILGLDASQAHAVELRDAAIAELAAARVRAPLLRDLASYSVARLR